MLNMKFSLFKIFCFITHHTIMIIFISYFLNVSNVLCDGISRLDINNIQNNIIFPGILLKNQTFRQNPGLYKIPLSSLKENQWYKIVAHYPSSVKFIFIILVGNYFEY